MQIHQANITVIFYFDSGNEDFNKLSHQYIVRDWEDEDRLRTLLHEIAHEMHYISGYGIESIKVVSDHLKFRLNYKDQYSPAFEKYDFNKVLRFSIGNYGERPRRVARLEVPRIFSFTPAADPVKKYTPHDSVFYIRARYVNTRKKSRITEYVLDYDQENPIVQSFRQKIYHPGILLPFTTSRQPLHHTVLQSNIIYPIQVWSLPYRKTTQYYWDTRRKEFDRQQKAQKRERQYLESTKIIYKDKNKKIKANQVYIVQMDKDEVSHVYKIGISNAPGKRLKALQTSSPFALSLVHHFIAEPAEDAEAQLHKNFREYQLSGEWFRLSPEQISELKQIVEYTNGKFFKRKTEDT